MHHLYVVRGRASLGIAWVLILLALLTACQPVPTPAPLSPASSTSLPAFAQVTPAPSSTPQPAEIQPSLQPAVSQVATQSAPQAATQAASPTAQAAEGSLPVSTVAPAAASQVSLPETASAPAPSATAPSPTPLAASSTSAACVDKAAFYGDVTIPDDTGFEQAASFTKTWRFRNEGDCTWDSSYSLVFAGGEILNAPLISPLTSSIAPGQIADLSLEMRTPDRGGTFRSYWEFQNTQGARFGTGAGGHDPFWVQVVVSWMPPGGGNDSGGVSPTPPASGEGSSSQGNPGQGNPGQGNPGQGSPGQGSPGAQPTQPASGGTPPPAETPPANPGQGQNSLPGMPAGCDARSNNGYLQSLLNQVNRLRRDNGLDELAPSAPLYTAAAIHSADMACRNFVDHIGSDGSSWYTRIAAQGYSYSTALENIMVANPDFGGDAQYAFNWWLNSQIHRDNMLNPKVTEVGLGYVYNPLSEYGGYFTLVLARP